MTRLRNNVFANFAGQAWAAMIGLVFLPIYIRFLGIEAYGMVGFFLSLQAFFAILDFGLSATINRELARRLQAGRAADEIRDLVRTLEWVYWPLGLLVAGLTLLASGPIATHWLNPVDLGREDLAQAIALMGVAAALQWPTGFYVGGFSGIERQVLLNALNACFATLRAAGAALVLWLWSPTLEAFLLWQVAVAALQTLVFHHVFWRLLPAGSRPAKASGSLLREVHAFALGMTAILALSFLLMQSDRIILSKLLPLDEFGYYTVAAAVAAALARVIHPFFSALYPRYCALVASGERDRLIDLYHHSNQLLAVVVCSVAAMLVFFAADILRLWTGDPLLAAKSGPVLALLALGTALNGLMNLPYALQLAYGWTRLAIQQNIVAVLLVIPGTWWLARHYGMTGAAIMWVALNLAYVLISIPLMHRRLLPREMARWYKFDVLPAALTAGVTAGCARIFIAPLPRTLSGLLLLAGTASLVVMASATATAVLRSKRSRVPESIQS
ncbi:oligosaccharide flippase family protein [Thermomonas sp.]|uniref:lipopolysaccharide biosynthesis protein n=1 Tax=Thermomonas sp. TaxID=1971895 RepID=UPI0024897546|nr:oligosaccharide flippase family protein [Thermomonas sp.]MDI1254300.1 oligosaccharide flippase family protein [Thermomonas sp.]